MKQYDQTMVGDLAPSASGLFQIGTAQKPFASGNFKNLYGDGSHLTGLPESTPSPIGHAYEFLRVKSDESGTEWHDPTYS